MFPVVTVYIISMFTHSFRETGASLSSKAEPTSQLFRKITISLQLLRSL